MTFHFGKDAASELTEAQVIDQCRMYIAAVRLAEEFGCDRRGSDASRSARFASCRHSGAERSEEPGIHNHYRARPNSVAILCDLGLWISGLAALRRPGMTP